MGRLLIMILSSMHEFFMVSTTWIYRERLKWLERNYGLAGVGFYWKAVAQIGLSGGSTPMAYLMALRGRGIRYHDIELIIQKSGLFVNNDNCISLVDTEENGLHRKDAHKATGARTTGAGATGTSATGAGARPGPCSQLEEKNRTECAREEKFYRFMQTRCPNLLLMEQPLTLDEFLTLRQDFGTKAVQEVLLDMENRTDLHARNCFHTAHRWLERRSCHK